MRRLGAPLTPAELEAVYAEARTCLGVKWRHMGREGIPYGHNVGLDCVGLLIRVVRASGRDVGDIRVYARASDGEELLARMDEWLGERVPRAAVGAGCIMMMLIGGNPHVGLVVAGPDGRPMLEHCYNGVAPAGRVMWHGLDDAWRAQIHAGWRL